MKNYLFLAILAFSFLLTGFTKEDATRILKNNKIEVTEKNLCNAIEEKDKGAMELLVDAGLKGSSSIYDNEMSCFTSSFYAITTEEKDKIFYEKIIKKMIENGANINVAGDDLAPLTMAAASGSEELTKLLIKKGANVNYLSKSGETALYYPVVYNFPAIAKILLDAGANKELGSVEASGGKPVSLKQWALDHNNEELVNMLFSKQEKIFITIDKISHKFYGIVGGICVILAFIFASFIGFIIVLLLFVFLEEIIVKIIPFVVLLIIGLILYKMFKMLVSRVSSSQTSE